MEQITTLIGSFAAFLTTISFVPQVIRTVKLKETRDISLTMYILFCIGVFLWLVYGIALHAAPLILANAITLVFALIILICKLKYG